MKATKEKKLTLEMPLEELQEVREIWYAVCAFNQLLNKLDGDEDDYFTLRQFHKPLHDRFTALLAGEPAWDQRMVKVEMESEELTHPEADKSASQIAPQEVAQETVRVRKDNITEIRESWMKLAHIVDIMDQEKYFDLYELLEPIKRRIGNVMIGDWAGLPARCSGKGGEE